MPYLIDGHNLIPKVPGLSLSDMDDEQKLLEMLQDFCRMQRKQVEVFFDNAPAGGARVRSFGELLLARFVRQETTADEAIRKRLAQLGREARNWTVVSSDGAVQREARAAHAQVIGSEAFVQLMQRAVDDSQVERGKDPQAGLSEDELDEWLDLFNQGGG